MIPELLTGITIASGILALLDMPKAPEVIDINKIKKGALHGDKRSQYKLALCYIRGEHIEKDELLSLHWLTCSASQNYNKAQYALGLFFGHKKDSEENIQYAIYWLKKASWSGNHEAKLALAEINRKCSEFTEDDFKYE